MSAGGGGLPYMATPSAAARKGRRRSGKERKERGRKERRRDYRAGLASQRGEGKRVRQLTRRTSGAARGREREACAEGRVRAGEGQAGRSLARASGVEEGLARRREGMGAELGQASNGPRPGNREREGEKRLGWFLC